MKLENLNQVTALSNSLLTLRQQREAWRGVSTAVLRPEVASRAGETGRGPEDVKLIGEDALHLIDVQIQVVTERLTQLGVKDI